MNKYRTLLCAMALYLLWSPTSFACGSRGCALVDARWSADLKRPSFTLVEWDGTFLDHRDGMKPGYVTAVFESRWGDDGSVPNTTVIWNPGLLTYNWAHDQVTMMLDSVAWSPTYYNGIPDPKRPPKYFSIEIDRGVHDPSDSGLYTLFVQVRNWSGLVVPVSCEVTSANMTIGPVLNDAVAFSTAPVSLRCDGAAQYRMTVGAANGSDLVQYTSGGRVRMSIDGAGGTNIVSGHVDKNQPVHVAIRATTVPGTALPGKYTASAVVSVDIL